MLLREWPSPTRTEKALRFRSPWLLPDPAPVAHRPDHLRRALGGGLQAVEAVGGKDVGAAVPADRVRVGDPLAFAARAAAVEVDPAHRTRGRDRADNRLGGGEPDLAARGRHQRVELEALQRAALAGDLDRARRRPLVDVADGRVDPLPDDDLAVRHRHHRPRLVVEVEVAGAAEVAERFPQVGEGGREGGVGEDLAFTVDRDDAAVEGPAAFSRQRHPGTDADDVALRVEGLGRALAQQPRRRLSGFGIDEADFVVLAHFGRAAGGRPQRRVVVREERVVMDVAERVRRQLRVLPQRFRRARRRRANRRDQRSRNRQGQ